MRKLAERVRAFKVDCRGNHAPVDGQGTSSGLDCAGGTQQVARHGFCGAHGHRPALRFTESSHDGNCFGWIVLGGSGAVGIDVIHGVGLEPGIFESQGDGPRLASPFGVGLGDVVGVGRGAAAGELGVGIGTSIDPEVPRLRQPRVLWKAVRGTLEGEKGVSLHRAKCVTITSSTPLTFTADGEFLGESDTWTIETVPNALTVLMP